MIGLNREMNLLIYSIYLYEVQIFKLSSAISKRTNIVIYLPALTSNQIAKDISPTILGMATRAKNKSA